MTDSPVQIVPTDRLKSARVPAVQNEDGLKNVWILTGIVVLYGLANGLLQTTAPQAVLALKFNSQQLGWIGAAIPIGYTMGCLLFGRLFIRVRGKHVLLGGILMALASILGVASARHFLSFVTALVGYGLGSAAVWPFASAWMLDFQSEGIPKSRILRHYNIAWTSGTAAGMYTSGLLCSHKLIFQTFYFSAAMAAVVFVCACVPRMARHAIKSMSNAEHAGTPPPISAAAVYTSLPVLLAAVCANLAALGTRAVIVTNYAELNSLLKFDADRMGLFAAAMLLSQLIAFAFGALYEPWLGLRRVYFFLALALAATNIAFATCISLFVLLPAVLLTGIVLAVSFQTGIVAATAYFSSSQGGTTFHEAVIGVGGMAPLLFGAIVAALKADGLDAERALRIPFIYMASSLVLVLTLQLVLISTRVEHRSLANAHQGKR